jgi:hypothetical protein
VKTLPLTHSPAKDAATGPTRGRSPVLRSTVAAVAVAVLILELSTGCGASGTGRVAGAAPQPGLVFITILMIVVGVFLLLQVSRIVGQIFELATRLASAFASILLVLALAAGAVIVAVFALATG